MHIVSTDPVALAWGESPLNAGLGAPFLDAGYTGLPLPPEWIVEIALEVDKTADPTEVETGEQTTFTVVISVPSTAGASVTNINFTDTLPPGWEYVTGSTTIGGSPYADPDSIDVLSSGWILTWNGDWTISPSNSLTIDFKAFPTLSADTDNPNRNGATATGTSLGAPLTADDDAYVAIIKPVGGEIIPIEKLSIFLSQYWILILLLLLPFSFVLYKKRDMVIRLHLRIIRFCC
jgi:uncharacterized repeat protein (TIGR01451 family)